MPAHTLYGIDLEVALGLGRETDWGVWDSSTWDGATWGDPDTALGDWVDVTCEVLDGLSLNAGAAEGEGVVTRWEAATCAFTLVGADWDSWNGPYAGRVGPQVPVRVRWRTTSPPGAWTHAFEGTVDDQGWDWTPAAPGGLPQAGVLATDYTSDLAAWDGVPVAPVGGGETAAARVTRILDLADWSTDRRAVTAGGATMAPTALADEAWAMLLDVADADLGLLWVRRDGFLAYIPQGRVAIGTKLAGRLAVCPEGPDDIQIVDMGRPQVQATRNVVSIARAPVDDVDVPVVAVRSDPSSVARYRSHAYSRTDLGHASDAWSATVAEAVLGAGAWPSAAPAEVVVASGLGDPRVAPLLLSLEANHYFDVVDNTGTVWSEAVVGWDVEVRYASISGTLTLNDVSRWVGSGQWDAARWDFDRWGLGGPT